MKWQDIAGTAADLGLPILATAFGIPGPVATFAAKMVKKALGLPASASADDVQSTIEGMDPEVAKAALEGAQSDVAEEYKYLTRIVEIQGQNATEVNKTIRAEIGKIPWWSWRHLVGYLVLLQGLVLIAIIGKAGFFAVSTDQIAAITALITATSFFTVGLFGLLGVVAVNNTTRASTAITGAPPETIASKVINAATGGKKR